MSTSEQSVENKTWELSLYELNRTPQEVITDNTEIAVSPRSLHSEIMCPICLDMLKITMTTKKCLHRFCQDCIITALRSGNKECPTCREKLISKRSLRPDPNFDTLIEKIYPSREEYEQHQERVLAKLHKNHSHASLIHSIEEGIKQQSQNRQKSKKVDPEDERVTVGNNQSSAPSAPTRGELNSLSNSGNSNTMKSHTTTGPGPKSKKPRLSIIEATSENESGPGSSVESNNADGNTESISSNEIELVFRPHPLEMNEDNELIRELKDSSIRYIKTTANATVDHLSKYLAMRLTLATRTGELETELPSSLNNFCIYVAPTPDLYQVLSGSLTLEQVNEKHLRVKKPMEMFYSWKKS